MAAATNRLLVDDRADLLSRAAPDGERSLYPTGETGWQALPGRLAWLELGGVGEDFAMTNQTARAVAMQLMPPGFLLWAGIYTAVFYVCGGMIAAMYSND